MYQVARRQLIAIAIATTVIFGGSAVGTVAGGSPDVEFASDPLLDDARSVARSFDISVDLAAARVADEERFRAFVDAVSTAYDTFVGSWTDDAGGHFVLFRDSPPAAIARLAQKSDISVTVMGEGRRTEAELQELSDAIGGALIEAGLEFTAAVSVRDQKVIVTIVGEPGEVGAMLPEYARSPDFDIRYGTVSTLTRYYVYGGAKMYLNTTFLCTTGFTAFGQPPGDQGFVSAGHCGVVNKYQNPFTLALLDTFRERNHQGAYGDMGFYQMGAEGMEPTFFAAPGQLRSVLSVRPVASFGQGQTVCMYGRASNQAACGTIRYTSYTCAGIQRLVVMNQLIGQPGDSGGPWYYLNEAVGLVTGACNPVDGAERAVFTKAVYVNRSDTIVSTILLD